jgi:charged multivesicular body protein 2A
MASPLAANRQPVAVGETSGSARPNAGGVGGDGIGGNTVSDEDALQARLDALRRG